MNVKNAIEYHLRSTNRTGMEDLVSHLNEIGFFTSPASTKYHSVFDGGLASHSLDVYIYMDMLALECSIIIPGDTKIITALLHDVCKAGLYLKKSKYKYAYNEDHPKGHAALSLATIKRFIELSQLEEDMIKFHMGVWGTTEFSVARGEYTVLELTTALNAFPEINMMIMSDSIAALTCN